MAKIPVAAVKFYQDARDLCWDSYLHGSRSDLLLQHVFISRTFDPITGHCWPKVSPKERRTRKPGSVQNTSSTIMKSEEENRWGDVEEGQRTIRRKASEKRKTQHI